MVRHWWLSRCPGWRGEALSAAVSLGDEVVAVTVVPGEADEEERAAVEALRRDWELWRPGVPLGEIPSARRELARPLVR